MHKRILVQSTTMAPFRWASILAIGVAAAAPQDLLITDLPGAPTGFNFSQYSGFINVDPELGKNLFFWFVESQGNPSTDPLLLWLNGGPGSSSVGYGFFLEHGPFKIQPDGQTLKLNEWAWNKDANIIYLESPAGVGFSNSEDPAGLATNDSVTANNTFTFLENWFELFPEYKGVNDFYVTGESYGGHYVPTLASKILDEKPSWLSSMKGIGIGNPGIENDWYYNVNEYAFLTFAYQHALVPQPAYLAASEACGWSHYLTDCHNESFYDTPSSACKVATVSALAYLPKSWDPYDVTAPTCHAGDNDLSSSSSTGDKKKVSASAGSAFVAAYSPALEHLKVKYGLDTSYDPCVEDYATAYLNQAEVQTAIHVTPGTVWRPSGGIDYDNPGDVMVPYFERFLRETDWRILVWSGDADAAVPFEGTQRWIECLGQPVVEDWDQWFTNDVTYGWQVGGNVKVFEGISFITVKGCGHTVQSYCPQQGYDYYHNWLTEGKY